MSSITKPTRIASPVAMSLEEKARMEAAGIRFNTKSISIEEMATRQLLERKLRAIAPEVHRLFNQRRYANHQAKMVSEALVSSVLEIVFTGISPGYLPAALRLMYPHLRPIADRVCHFSFSAVTTATPSN